MLKYTTYDIVFQEIPDEITLAINISNCPNKCKGCHSPELQENIGNELNWETMSGLIQKYEDVTCICFMGGDRDVKSLYNFAVMCKALFGKRIAWYSGKNELPKSLLKKRLNTFDYIKLGEYIQSRGPLNDPNTNQRLYKYSELYSDYTIDRGWKDITHKFWNNG